MPCTCIADEAERMAGAKDRRTAGERHIHRAGGSPRGRERGFPFGDCRFDRLLEVVDLAAEIAALVSR